MTIKEYYEELQKHDWYYRFSDDGSYYWKGLANEDRLLKIANESERLKQLYNDYKNAMFSGPPFKSQRLEIPKCPE